MTKPKLARYLAKALQAVIVLGSGIYIGAILADMRIQKEKVVIMPESPYYLLEECNSTSLYQTLKHYEFPAPETITAQAVLETGNFQSRLFLKYNNLFGLYDSRRMEYMRFDSWISCVFAYRKYILNKYREDEEYYTFLTRIGYAEDSTYVSKVKQIEKQLYE